MPRDLRLSFRCIVSCALIITAHSAEDPTVTEKYRKLCSELTGVDDDEKFDFTLRQRFAGNRLESKKQLDARMVMTGIECRRIHWSCAWREPVDLGLDALFGKFECAYGSDWCSKYTEQGSERCELEPECFFDAGSPFEEDSVARCFYNKAPGTILTNGRVGREQDPWWDRNLISDEDQCTDPQCVMLQNAQRAFARALQLESMSSSAALGAYEEAIGAVVDTLGIAHPDTERMLIHARRYLDGFTVTQEMSAPELRMRDALSQRLLGLVTHDRSQLRSQ